MKQRLLPLLLALCMALPLLTVSATAAPPLLIAPNPNAAPKWLVPPAREAAEFPDITGTWCESYVDTVYRSGLMSGKSDAKFDAASPLTHAQITVITARLHNLLNGGSGVLPAAEEGQPWYQSAADYLAEQSKDEHLLYVLKELAENEGYADAVCLRQNFVWMLSAVLPELDSINEIDSIPDLSHSEENVLPFYRAGILNGSDPYGTFNADSPLTRGAAAAMLARIADPGQRLTFTLKPFDLCRNVLGVEPDTVLLTIEGTSIPAELFAEQLCTSLYQNPGSNRDALNDAIRFWCLYQGSFRVLAPELGITLSAEKQEDLLRAAEADAGYLGLPTSYWHFRTEGSALNRALRNHYIALDDAQGFNGKWGESTYQKTLEARAETMIQNAVPTKALSAMDLSAVYSRLKNSPFIEWRF